MPMPTDIDSLRRRFSIECLWQHFSLPGEPSAKQLRSPFRDDRSAGSFSVFVGDDGVQRWKDFATGEHGDCIDFAAKAMGAGTGDAIRKLKEMGGDDCQIIAPPTTSSAPEKSASDSMLAEFKQYSLPYSVSSTESQRCKQAQEALLDRPKLIQKLANWKGIKPETVRYLALGPQLGVERDPVTGKWQLAFFYESGLKLRRGLNVPKQERRIYWAFGLPCLWRMGPLLHPVTAAAIDTIYIAEGEPDCMLLVDRGIEDSGNSLVVGLPGASCDGLVRSSAILFREKHVVIATDIDEAGLRARGMLINILGPVAKSVSYLALEEMKVGKELAV